FCPHSLSSVCPYTTLFLSIMASAGYNRSAYLFFQLRKSPLTLVGLAIILLICLAALFAPYLAPHEPDMINLRARLQAPSWTHFLDRKSTRLNSSHVSISYA